MNKQIRDVVVEWRFDVGVVLRYQRS